MQWICCFCNIFYTGIFNSYFILHMFISYHPEPVNIFHCQQQKPTLTGLNGKGIIKSMLVTHRNAPQRSGHHGSKQYPKSLHRPETILWLPASSTRYCHCTTHVALPRASLLSNYSQVQCGRNVSESLSPSHMSMP